jgi:hypothetical protein
MPNVQVDFTPVQTTMRLADGTRSTLNLGLDAYKRIWQYECPYVQKRRFFYYYQPPVNDTVDPFNFNDDYAPNVV